MSRLQLQLILQLLFIFLFCSQIYSDEGVKWGSFRFRPELSISEEYTDNIFLTHIEEKEDFITKISPDLFFDFSLAADNYLSLNYKGDFRFHKNFQNFKKDIHHTGLSWVWIQPAGSKFELGGRYHLDSVQPFSEEARNKDFTFKEAFLDTLWNLGDTIELGLKYNYRSRRFDEFIDQIDDYDRNGITFDVAYQIYPVTVLLLEYSFLPAGQQ